MESGFLSSRLRSLSANTLSLPPADCYLLFYSTLSRQGDRVTTSCYISTHTRQKEPASTAMQSHLTALEQMIVPGTSRTNRRTADSTTPNNRALPTQQSTTRLQPPVSAVASPATVRAFQVIEPLGLPDEYFWCIIQHETSIYMPGHGTAKCKIDVPVAHGQKQRPMQMRSPPGYGQYQPHVPQGQMHQLHVAPQPQRAEELLREAARQQAHPIQRFPVPQAQARSYMPQGVHPQWPQGVPPQPQMARMQSATVPSQPQHHNQPQLPQPNLADVMRQLMAPSPAPQQGHQTTQQYQPQQRVPIPQQQPSPTLQGVCPNVLAGSARRKRTRPQKDNSQGSATDSNWNSPSCSAAKRPMPPLPVPDLPPLKENFTSRSPHA